MCAKAISAPITSAVTTSTRDAAREPDAQSATATTRMRNDSSTAWIARCSLSALASRRASASPVDRGASASSPCDAVSPDAARATTTPSVSALISVAHIAASRPHVTYPPDREKCPCARTPSPASSNASVT